MELIAVFCGTSTKRANRNLIIIMIIIITFQINLSELLCSARKKGAICARNDTLTLTLRLVVELYFFPVRVSIVHSPHGQIVNY